MQMWNAWLRLGTLALVSALCTAGCGGDDSAARSDGNQQTTNARVGVGAGGTAAPSSAAATGGGVPGAANAQEPQGSCPTGFACTPIPVGDNQRACIAPGELFAPSCKTVADCSALPGALCTDIGMGFGSLCALTCKI